MSVAYQWFLFSAFAYFTRWYYSRTFYNHAGRFYIIFRFNFVSSSCCYHFCSSRGCLWECVTVKTRFYRPKRLSIFILINIFCGLERSLHPFGPDFDTVLNSLLLSDSTLTNISIRNIWVTEAKYSCAFIGLRRFAIRYFVAVQAPVELKNISIFPSWSRDRVS